MAADCAANTARPLVGGERQRATAPFTPKIEQGRREERQSAGHARDIVNKYFGECPLDLEPCRLGRPLDHAA